MADVTPGQVSRDGNNLTIRGIGQAHNGTSPVVSHVNDYFINEHEAAEVFYDISSVEVFRGPSGTVYGRSVTGCANNVRWSRPSEYGAGGLACRHADCNAECFRGYINLPLLGDGNLSLMARFASQWQSRGGHIDNLLAPSDEEPDIKAELSQVAAFSSTLGELGTVYRQHCVFNCSDISITLNLCCPRVQPC